jgi:cytochrome c biogenesis protein CcmG/thiol:disulfide interchange protein DsbE
MMAKLYFATSLAFALMLGGCASKEEDLEFKIKPLAERQAAPTFELKDVNGANATLADYKDKVVLVNFWATWCVPCRAEIPWFQEFDKKYKDQGFSVLGVSMDEEGWNIVKPYLEERKISYRIVLGDEHVSTMYGGIDALPTTFLIDRQGKIAAIHTGLVSKATYEKEIQDLVGNKNVGSNHAGSATGELALLRAK